MTEHSHVWEKTGEAFAMNPPKWFVACKGCCSVGYRMDHWPDGDVEQVRQVSPEEFRQIPSRPFDV
jgi:hypothetical protein